MIVGRFERIFGRPTVDCHVTISAVKIDGVVPFLIDTGADTTVLMPVDGRRLRIPYNELTNEWTAYGFGGAAKVFRMSAVLIVSDDKTAYAYRFPLEIAEPRDDFGDMPSLLGRDILR